MTIIQKIEKGEFELYLHPKQKDGYITGTDLYEHLKKENLLEDCATVEDLEEIQKQGVKFFKKYFKNQFVYGWKSVRRLSGGLSVPYLFEDDDEVVLLWRWTAYDWDGSGPALRHASSAKTSEINSGTLSLDLAIETVKNAGYSVKKKTYFITGQGQVMEMGESEKVEKRRKFLGSYETKEEALKVVEEISKKYGESRL